VIHFKCLRIATNALCYIGNRQIHDDLGVPYFSDHTRTVNKVRELIAVKVLHTSLLNTTVVAFKVLPFGSNAPTPAPSPLFKTILELALWNGLQTCRLPDVINVNKVPSFQYFLYLREQKKVIGARSGE